LNGDQYIDQKQVAAIHNWTFAEQIRFAEIETGTAEIVRKLKITPVGPARNKLVADFVELSNESIAAHIKFRIAHGYFLRNHLAIGATGVSTLATGVGPCQVSVGGRIPNCDCVLDCEGL
jgi:hypothetical protein